MSEIQDIAAREIIMRALWAELDRQCSIGAGEWHSDSETGLMCVNAGIDPHGMATALVAASKLATPATSA